MFGGQPSPDTVSGVVLRRGPENGSGRPVGQDFTGRTGCAGGAGQSGGVVPVLYEIAGPEV